MLYFNFNGRFFKEDSAIIGPDSRGLRYGDGLFETMHYHNGKLVLADEHLARLWKGLQLLQFDIPKLFTPDMLQEQVMLLVKKNNQQYARVRLHVSRGKGGLYDTTNHAPSYIIQSWPLPAKKVSLNENGLRLCIYRQAKKSIDLFSNLKHNNYLPYFMAALFAKEQQCNDAVILNSGNNVCDSSLANIFIIKDGSVFTPALKEGCVAGVMRKNILQQLAATEYAVAETMITEDMLLAADEIFMSNAIMKMRWVGALDNRKYNNIICLKIFELLRQTNASIFC